MPAASRPLASDPLVALADRCVQCGLCLPVCPTYGRERMEAESPRGRIALARAWALDTIESGPLGDAHLDHCLGCGNCETVCPAGVEYDALLVSARGRQRERRGASALQKALEALVVRPRLLGPLVGLYRHTRSLLPHRLQLLPAPPSPASAGSPSGRRTPPVQSAALFLGCMAGPYEVNARGALIRLCAAAGIDVVVPPGQTCCGALHAHAGNIDGAAHLTARNREAFAGHPQVLTLASGCHKAVAGAIDGEALDALTLLDAHSDRLAFHPHAERIALHLPCTQRNASGSVPALRRLLARIPELMVIEIDVGFGCCGAAGNQMVTDPARASEYRQPLLDQFAASGASRLLSANIGCRLHLGNGTALPVQHPLEFLAEALERANDPLPPLESSGTRGAR
ncbi:(Fe-S)-binding protein [Lysobacter sp. A03]|uniref:(Fe-S)-binding protein n=1 Tax=Lysobacter sp. A03 TaxID=1199154 RepID=UPI0005B6C79B|nr:(Fe-S)-binding protein [Lysobacter sp. A03]KIQ97601.1 Glycolate dehydrogenase, iron-sulfur subunit GlcF [Lysobacter sp. A03]